MTTSSLQLRQSRPSDHSSSLTLYTHGKSTKTLALRPSLAERDFGGKVAILPTKMTNGVSTDFGGPIVISEKQKANNEKRASKIYVSCLQTSLSTTWRKHSTENIKKESDFDEENDIDDMASKNLKYVKRNEKNRAIKGHNINDKTASNIEANLLNGRERAGRRKNRLERQDSNVSIQLPKGKQLNITSERKSSTSSSYSESNLNSPKTSSSFVYIKNKLSSNEGNAVSVQKSPLCRSITISEASLSSALNRQANISTPNRSSSRQRNSQRFVSAISIQNKNKRSFTISNDTTDGRLRTIYESTMEEIHD